MLKCVYFPEESHILHETGRCWLSPVCVCVCIGVEQCVALQCVRGETTPRKKKKQQVTATRDLLTVWIIVLRPPPREGSVLLVLHFTVPYIRLANHIQVFNCFSSPPYTEQEAILCVLWCVSPSCKRLCCVCASDQSNPYFLVITNDAVLSKVRSGF